MATEMDMFHSRHKPCSKSSTDPEPFSGFVCFSPGAGCKVSDLPKSPPKCWADEWPGTFAPSWCKSWFGATQQSVCSSFGVGNVEIPMPSSLSKVRFHYKWLASLHGIFIPLCFALHHPANVEGRQHERTWCPIGATSCVDLRAEAPTSCKTVQTTPVILRQPNLAKWQCLWNFHDATSEIKRLQRLLARSADFHECFQVAQSGLGCLGYLALLEPRKKCRCRQGGNAELGICSLSSHPPQPVPCWKVVQIQGFLLAIRHIPEGKLITLRWGYLCRFTQLPMCLQTTSVFGVSAERAVQSQMFVSCLKRLECYFVSSFNMYMTNKLCIAWGFAFTVQLGGNGFIWIWNTCW